MKLYFTLFFCLVLSLAQGQDFDDIISKNRFVDCQDVSFNALSIIKDFNDNNQTQKIYEFLNYWESKCGASEITNRLKTILDIKYGRFDSFTMNSSTIEDMANYKGNLKFVRDSTSLINEIPEFSYIRQDLKLMSSLNSLTQYIAQSSSAGSQDNQYILNFYADPNPSFSAIKTAPNSSKLKFLHANAYEEARKMWQWHYAFVGGVVNYQGDLSIFGTRPFIGMALGAKRLRHNLDMVVDFRLGPSKEEYSFVYQGDLITDDSWNAFYVGAEYTYDFINTNKIDLGVSGGIGYESITAIQGDEDTDEDGKFLESFNTNAGLVFKYKYGKRGGYAGLQLRYNWADYSNRGGTPLQGNYLNLRLTFGKLFNFDRHERLQNLE